MENNSTIQNGEIIDFETSSLDSVSLISTTGAGAQTAWLIIKVDGQAKIFGGPNLFVSIPNEEPDFFEHFVTRTLQIAGVSSTDELAGVAIKVRVSDDDIIGIASPGGDDFFYPGKEFEILEKGEEEIEHD
jgi:hypothetical protein